ncbi:hypothetical protein NIES4071_10040 [Calothrix sp. NIES-4071]|nr:hypothetical protein NIES4071_10040 [Calothrix sp. NIES-4071]BAZ55346.1 hypothetical protein NIES4105_10000 [Calothrix sp. NIES-4105]
MSPISSSVLDNSNQSMAPLNDDVLGDVLTEAQAEEFKYLEARVEECLKSFWEIGRALGRIRDERLYRENYKTFEEYCMTRWEMSRRSAYQLIDAAIIYRNISENIIDEDQENVKRGKQKIKILPANERQIRPLVVLSPKQQQEAWSKVVSTAPNGKVTAVHVACVVNEYRRGAVASKDSKINTLVEIDSEQTRSCWNCSHCSKELPENTKSYYCYKLGELSLLEKSGNERGAECPHWNHRNISVENKNYQPETFDLNVQLPSHLRPLIQDAARESGIVINEWVAKAIEEALQKVDNSNGQQETDL